MGVLRRRAGLGLLSLLGLVLVLGMATMGSVAELEVERVLIQRRRQLLDCEALAPTDTNGAASAVDQMLTFADANPSCLAARQMFFERGHGSIVIPYDDFMDQGFKLAGNLTAERRDEVLCPTAALALDAQNATEVSAVCLCPDAPLMYKIVVTEHVCDDYVLGTNRTLSKQTRDEYLERFKRDRDHVATCDFGKGLMEWCVAANHTFSPNFNASDIVFFGSAPLPYLVGSNVERTASTEVFRQLQCDAWCNIHCDRWPQNECSLIGSECKCEYASSVAGLLVVPFAILFAIVLVFLYSFTPCHQRYKYKNMKEDSDSDEDDSDDEEEEEDSDSEEDEDEEEEDEEDDSD